jgi:hypothetical protein
MTGNPFRRIASLLGAYLLVLHAFGMGAMAAPAAVEAPLLVICTLEAQNPSPGTPDHAPVQHAPCALCGLGACAIVAPPSNALLAPLAIGIAAPLMATRSALPIRTPDSARPRGPPLAA